MNDQELLEVLVDGYRHMWRSGRQLDTRFHDPSHRSPWDVAENIYRWLDEEPDGPGRGSSGPAGPGFMSNPLAREEDWIPSIAKLIRRKAGAGQFVFVNGNEPDEDLIQQLAWYFKSNCLPFWEHRQSSAVEIDLADDGPVEP